VASLTPWKHSDGLAVSGSRSRSGPPAEPDEAAIAAGARRPPPAMRQGEPDEGRLEIPRVDPGQRGERLEPGETPRVSLGLAQAEVLGRPASPLVAGRTGADQRNLPRWMHVGGAPSINRHMARIVPKVTMKGDLRHRVTSPGSPRGGGHVQTSYRSEGSCRIVRRRAGCDDARTCGRVRELDYAVESDNAGRELDAHRSEVAEAFYVVAGADRVLTLA
jgi:hypothetical protein